jgi:uncharacterized protein
MSDEEFEWDERKAASNFAKHGVTFDSAQGVFSDPFAIEFADDGNEHDEVRFRIIGMSAGVLLFVAYAMRGETIRIISARGAEPYERRWYYEDQL